MEEQENIWRRKISAATGLGETNIYSVFYVCPKRGRFQRLGFFWHRTSVFYNTKGDQGREGANEKKNVFFRALPE